MSWSERFGSKLSGQRNAVANDSAALGGRTSRISHLSERGADSASGISSAVNGVRPIRSRMLDYDHSLLWVTIALLGLGIVMVYSASIAMPDSPKYAQYRDYHFLVRHLISVTTAIVGAIVAFKIPVSAWDKYAPKLFLIALLMLVVVLIPHVGKGVNGARRWIPLGITNMQPSEIMKLAVTIYAANYTVRKQEFMHSFGRGFLPMAVAVGAVGALLLLEPDMGAFMVIAAIAMGVLFLGGVNGKLFGGLVLTAVGTFTMLVWLSPWRRERIFAYLDPWDDRYAQGKAYQLTHSLIAFGRGEWFGVGLGGSVEKLNYLPEAHTDFILAVIGEELGFRRRDRRDPAVLLDRATRVRNRPSGARARPHVCRADGERRRHLVRRADLHQHGREPRPPADQGSHAAARELRRFGHLAELRRARGADARGL